MGGGAYLHSVACSNCPRQSSCPHQCVSSTSSHHMKPITRKHHHLMLFDLFVLYVSAVILLRLHDALEGFLVQDVFLMMHELFAGRFVDPHIHIHNQQSTTKCVSTRQDSHGCAGSDQVALPDNSEVDSLHNIIYLNSFMCLVSGPVSISTAIPYARNLLFRPWWCARK